MMVSVVCPICNSQNNMSLKVDEYEGPFVCWKCKNKLMIKIEGSSVTSCQIIDNEEYSSQLNENHINRRYI